MPREPVPGIYEELITAEVEAAIRDWRARSWQVRDGVSDATLRVELLAEHLRSAARRALQAIPDGESGSQAQVELANRVLGAIARETGDPTGAGDAVATEARVLLEVQSPALGLATPAALARPSLSLRSSGLLINSRRDYHLAGELTREIDSADRIDLLCAFVRFSGVRLVREQLAAFTARGGRLRVISSVYTGATERRALDELVELGGEVCVSFETSTTRLHAKAWLFHRNSGFSTAYVGSSNLSRAALVDGLEWNVRLTQVENPGIVERFVAVFEQYWREPEFIPYVPARDGARLDAALSAERGGGSGAIAAEARLAELLMLTVQVAPRPVQIEMLEALAAERDHGHWRNLVVAATGTGKAWVAGFDYQRLRRRGFDSLLFVAHREEILRQSQLIFQLILKEPDFGELLVAGHRPARGQHVFASIQSLAARVGEIAPDDFDVVIVDEFHHAAAPTYERLLQRLRPRVLLGLTATPERADGASVLAWFDDRIATESRLWDALDQGLLCPFHYFGIHDGSDLSHLAFRRGRYVAGDLEHVLTGDDVRATRVLQAVAQHVSEPRQMRALGFCAGVSHAHFMARHFERAGLRAVALDATTAESERRGAVLRLRRGELQAIFTVDLFNEGVDIPEVDTILLLRPTESATVFLQQLGRGLRWAPGKSVLTVLDFIGQAHAEYRFDVRFRAIVGGTRRQVTHAVEEGFPLLPAGCAMRLDRIARDIVLNNLRRAVSMARRHLVAELRALGPGAGLGTFLHESGVELEELYQRPGAGHCFAALQRAAFGRGAPVSSWRAALEKVPGRLLHVNDRERLDTWHRWLSSAEPPDVAALSGREQRLAWMLFAALGHRRRRLAELPQALAELWQTPAIRDELLQLLALLGDRARVQCDPLDPRSVVPLASHAVYSLYEIIAAYGLVGPEGVLRETREGVLWAAESETDLLFVTVEKSEADYSPTTRYADYPLDTTLFQWESQSTTGADSPTGRRYREHQARGSKVVLLVRERKKDGRGETAPYLCLGEARYVSHQSERPMRIVWELARPMPGWFYQDAKVAAG